MTNMRNKALLASAALTIFISGCKKENAYTAYDNQAFHIEYPKTWESVENAFEVVPFAAYGAEGGQMIAVRTRLLDSVPENERTLEAFTDSRIKDFEESIINFQLQKRENTDDGAIILHFTSGEKESENSTFYESLMKLAFKDNLFYGVECAAADKAEKDTADHIIRSFCLK